jgi:hypothetical protein
MEEMNLPEAISPLKRSTIQPHEVDATREMSALVQNMDSLRGEIERLSAIEAEYELKSLRWCKLNEM